jgi:hypothetical protein
MRSKCDAHNRDGKQLSCISIDYMTCDDVGTPKREVPKRQT